MKSQIAVEGGKNPRDRGVHEGLEEAKGGSIFLSVRQLTNSAGTVTDSYNYDALGNSWTNAFPPSGVVLVAREGELYETSTGNLLAQLQFPQRDYPDN